MQILTELVVLLNNKESNCALNDQGRNKPKCLAKAALEILREGMTAVTVGCEFEESHLMRNVFSIAGEGRSF